MRRMSRPFLTFGDGPGSVVRLVQCRMRVCQLLGDVRVRWRARASACALEPAEAALRVEHPGSALTRPCPTRRHLGHISQESARTCVVERSPERKEAGQRAPRAQGVASCARTSVTEMGNWMGKCWRSACACRRARRPGRTSMSPPATSDWPRIGHNRVLLQLSLVGKPTISGGPTSAMDGHGFYTTPSDVNHKERARASNRRRGAQRRAFACAPSWAGVLANAFANEMLATRRIA